MRRVILILADSGDLAAQWLQAALRERSTVPVEWVTPPQLAYAPSIAQRMSTEGDSSCFRLWNGAQIDFENVSGVINRINAVPTAHLQHAAEAERDYAAGELHAFLLGWLASLECPVLNPPAPEWLAGPVHHEISALHLAAQAGLRCVGRGLDSGGETPPSLEAGEGMIHFVLDGRLIGPAVSVRDRDALLGFAHSWGARLLQVETRDEGGERRFLRATSLPDYRRGGALLVSATARVLGA